MKKLLLLVLAIGFALFFVACDETIENREIKSCVLRQEVTSETNGSFVIFWASVYSEESIKTDYYLYIKGDEGFRLQKIDSDNLEIVETDDIKPQIKGSFAYMGKISEYEDYIVYVPVGTITQEYKADFGSMEGAKTDE